MVSRGGTGDEAPRRAAEELGPALARASSTCAASEEDLFSVIPILGEPLAQRALDEWVDQAVDLLRALGEAAEEVRLRLALAIGDAGAGCADDAGGDGAGGIELLRGALPDERPSWARSAAGHPERPAFHERLPE